MRTSCIKAVAKDEDGSLRSFNSFGPFSQVYREPDGTINTVKSSLVFTEPDDVARFTNLSPRVGIWIASADAIEPRSWLFSSNFLNDLHYYYKDDPAVLRMKEIVLQCCNRTESPEDDQELNEAFDDVKDALGDWVPRIRVVDAPKGTFIASNLRLEKCINSPEEEFEEYKYPFKGMVERISKAFNEFNENLTQMMEKDTPQ